MGYNNNIVECKLDVNVELTYRSTKVEQEYLILASKNKALVYLIEKNISESAPMKYIYCTKNI